MDHIVLTPTPNSRTEKVIVLLLGVFTVSVLLVTAPQIGLTWDEPTYMLAAETYPHWYAALVEQPSYALSADGVARYWSPSHEHPPLSKVWSGFVWLVARNFLDDLTAHRLGAIFITGALIILLYRFVARRYGSLAGLVAAFALLSMPRFFFHAHLAAIDVPVTAMIFAVFYVFWLGHDQPAFRWTVLLGLVWGLALATKITALFIPPIVLFIWTLVFRRSQYLFLRLAMVALIGVGFFILSWPWLYHDLWNRLNEYVGFMTVGRLPVEQYYLGRSYAPPPWHFPLVITAVVVPFSILLLAIIGAISMMRQPNDRPLGGLLLLAIFVGLSIFSSGHGQVFDNGRFMMPVLPYLAALAGVGFVRIVPVAEQFLANRNIRLHKSQLITILMVIVFTAHILLAYDLYPHLLSYYSEVIGGAYGAKLLGFESTYWCDTYNVVLSYLNTHAPPNAVVWAECEDVLIYYQLHGRLRRDLKIANGPSAVSAFPEAKLSPATFQEADYVVIQYRQSGFYWALRKWMNARQPVYEFRYRRLRLAAIYAH